MLRNDFWGNNLTSKNSHKSWRPLTTLSFTLQRHFEGGLDSRSMKTINLIIHIINCCLMFHFLQAILADKKTHFYTILMFAVHPIHTEALAIVSRSDLLACLIFLLSGIIYFNVFHKGEWNSRKCSVRWSTFFLQTRRILNLNNFYSWWSSVCCHSLAFFVKKMQSW